MVQLVWRDLASQDLDDIAALARACLAADGGMPTLARESTVQRLFGSGPGIVGRDQTGDLVAVGALVRDSGVHPQIIGLVDPGIRGVGVGEDLLQWARGVMAGEPLRLVVENDSDNTREFAHRVGMARVFAEKVMRHSLERIPFVGLPDGLVALPWGPDTTAAFHHVWLQSFRERPGFAKMVHDEWVAWVESDPDFLPEESRVLFDGGSAVAFVTVATEWIDQVGVVPAWRGRGLGAHLMVRSLTALRRAGKQQVWIAVTEENTGAHALYLSLGFTDAGVRARYVDASVADG